MAVNEGLTAYSTNAAVNTPSGSDSVGPDLDDHIRSIKSNIRLAAELSQGSTLPDGFKGRLHLSTSASPTYTMKIHDGGGWINLFSIDASANTTSVYDGTTNNSFASLDETQTFTAPQTFSATVNTTVALQFEGADLIPAGVILGWGGSAAPTGWLICDGSTVSRTTYSRLFSAIGTIYGQGDGVTTFNLPEGSGRALIGAGQGLTGESSATGTTRVVGDRPGAETHTQTIAQMPAHNHEFAQRQKGGRAPGGTTIDGAGGTSLVNTVTTGSSSPMNNMQPSLCVNFIIKT